MRITTAIKKTAAKISPNKKTCTISSVSEQLVNADIFARKVEEKAYELYKKRGCQDGYDKEDWCEAEKIVEAEMIAGKC